MEITQHQEKYRCRECNARCFGPVIYIGSKKMGRQLCDDCDERINHKAFDDTPVVTPTVKPRTVEGWLEFARKSDCQQYADVQGDRLPNASRRYFPLNWNPIDNTQGILLIGPSGTGKSMLIHELAKRLWLAKHDLHITYMARFNRLVGSLRPERDAELDRCCNAAILVMDDLDKATFSSAVEQGLYDVLETRRRRGLPILCTMNASPSELRDVMGGNRSEPILNRLRDLCQFGAIVEEQRS